MCQCGSSGVDAARPNLHHRHDQAPDVRDDAGDGIGGQLRRFKRPRDGEIVDLRRRPLLQVLGSAEICPDPFGELLGIGTLGLCRESRLESLWRKCCRFLRG